MAIMACLPSIPFTTDARQIVGAARLMSLGLGDFDALDTMTAIAMHVEHGSSMTQGHRGGGVGHSW